MTQVLQLPELVEHHGVPDMDVGRRRVQAELDAQGLPGRLGASQLGLPIDQRKQLVATLERDGQRFAHTIGDGVGGSRGGGHDQRRWAGAGVVWRNGLHRACPRRQPAILPAGFGRPGLGALRWAGGGFAPQGQRTRSDSSAGPHRPCTGSAAPAVKVLSRSF